ncbi:DUF3995 domain-containing protein [Paenibacillus sp. GCM10023248]|uniref:DUF3995 domain-containing protein n=1 Tax=unclassified Paenibacillus TaxID=185978 RepID=UPI002377F326|nr:DUF3995 domain-containing protein [Paenibacillus sp. MAHUQ-63]MDD9270393.1 DUF3995 domain-containing protein [Paenibacillus sp. MAHUQ-63]
MVITILSCLFLFFIGALHVSWAFGVRWGSAAAIPVTQASHQPVFRPGITATLTVALLLFADTLLLGWQGRLIPHLPVFSWVTWGCWISLIVFGLRTIGDFRYVGLFKSIRSTRFAKCDTYLFTPLCLWLCFSFGYALTFSAR